MVILAIALNLKYDLADYLYAYGYALNYTL